MKKLIALLVGAYLFSLIITTPVSIIHRMVQAQLSGIGLEAKNIDGSVWHGKAHIAFPANTSPNIGLVAWAFKPTTLLSGKLGWDLTPVNLSTELSIAIYPWSIDRLQSVTLKTTAAGLLPLHPLLNSLESQITAELLNVQQGNCQDTTGMLNFNNARFMKINFGSINGILTCNTNAYQLAFTNQQSDITLKGKINLTADGQYQLNASLHTNDPTTRQQLATLLGDSANKHQFSVRESGHLSLASAQPK